ncbi:MAG TPA: hypothetical protein VLK33_17160, partial [Terriglobales bacterium]|nr:hypothetical protein [Terriglobales bacterium]
MNQTVGFCCYLDGQPDHLTPVHQLAACWNEELAGRPLLLNRNCEFNSTNVLSGKEPTDCFAAVENMIWVRNSITNTAMPFWIRPQLRCDLSELSVGKPTSLLRADDRRSLAIAGVLTSTTHQAMQNDMMTTILSRAADQVRTRGFAPVSGLIHPFHISALRRYFRTLIRTGKLTLGDTQSSRRYYAHNEPVAKFFHAQLTQVVSMIAGQNVKPSYVYFASYQEGAILEKHTDREQCQFSVSFCLDYSPEPLRQTSWPLQVHTREGVTKIYQSIG